MAADRHNKVTRVYIHTVYEIDRITINGRDTLKCEDFDGLTPVELEAVERMRLQRNNEIFAGLRVLSRTREMYGMGKDTFRASAELMSAEPAVDIIL